MAAANPKAGPSDGAADKPPLDQVTEALERMEFGTIQLTVHQGKLVQIDVTERRRFTSA